MNLLIFAKYAKEYIEMSLTEVAGCKDDFNIGQRYAYDEILELMQSLLTEQERKQIGLDYNIEEIFPLE